MRLDCFSTLVCNFSINLIIVGPDFYVRFMTRSHILILMLSQRIFSKLCCLLKTSDVISFHFFSYLYRECMCKVMRKLGLQEVEK